MPFVWKINYTERWVFDQHYKHPPAYEQKSGVFITNSSDIYEIPRKVLAQQNNSSYPKIEVEIIDGEFLGYAEDLTQ